MDESESYNKLKQILFKNNYVTMFASLTALILLIGILNLAKVTLGSGIIGQTITLFSAGIWLLLALSLLCSTILAYYEKYALMVWPILIWILITTTMVRTSNISGLKDVTTNDWTLAPDLDPYLYLRNVQDIVSGNLTKIDSMRYPSTGVQSWAYGSIMPWTLVGIYKIMTIFSSTVSPTYSMIIGGPIFFAIGLIGFFLFIYLLASMKFNKAKSALIAIFASLFYSFTPTLLERTMAGVTELESLGMMFFWFAFLFFTLAWKSEKLNKQIVFGILAGIFTGLMEWSWGGYRYIFMIISLATFCFFIFEKEKSKNSIIFVSWIIPAILTLVLQGSSIKTLMFRFTDTGLAIFVLALMIIYWIVSLDKISKLSEKIKLPKTILSILLVILLGIIAIYLREPTNFVSTFSGIIETLLYPYGRERVALTVAENAAPYFTQILSSLGYLTWFFLITSILFFYEITKHFNSKNNVLLNSFFIVFITTFIFSRFSSTSILNGDNFISKLLYLGGLIVFAIVALSIYIKAFRINDEKTLNDFKNIDFSYILLLSFAFFGIISMRGAIRLLYIITPFVIIISAFLPVLISNYAKHTKDNLIKGAFTIALIIILILSTITLVQYSAGTVYSAKNMVPSQYNQQWQKAMSWARNSTDSNDIFVHWWDYGYWVQTIGQRPTVTDGGHFIGYWDHLIGRYVLTTPNEETALSFMKTHNVSYFLIDSSDIGKYSAFSSIGGDNNNDRVSYIATFLKNTAQTVETRNSTSYIYTGNGFMLDDDLVYYEGSKQIILPAGAAGLAGIKLDIDSTGAIQQPIGIFVYQNTQYRLPIRYLFLGKMIDFGSGVDSTAYLIPSLNQGTSGMSIDKAGAMMYLSKRTSQSELAKLYLYGEENKYITLAHSEDDFVVSYLKSQGAMTENESFVYFQGVRGPIKIWEITYDNSILINPEFLRTSGGYAEFDNLTFVK